MAVTKRYRLARRQLGLEHAMRQQAVADVSDRQRYKMMDMNLHNAAVYTHVINIVPCKKKLLTERLP